MSELLSESLPVRREQILTAAMICFARCGFHLTTTKPMPCSAKSGSIIKKSHRKESTSRHSKRTWPTSNRASPAPRRSNTSDRKTWSSIPEIHKHHITKSTHEKRKPLHLKPTKRLKLRLNQAQTLPISPNSSSPSMASAGATVRKCLLLRAWRVEKFRTQHPIADALRWRLRRWANRHFRERT